MKIKFFGAAQEVTGSCFLLEHEDISILVDCGMFQGISIEDRNYEKFAFEPSQIDIVILTHAHLDHCGLLPKLYKHGFRGTVYATPPTRAVSELMLLDSAKVQELRFRNGKKAQYKGWNIGVAEATRLSFQKPLYDTTDVMNLMTHFEVVAFKQPKVLNQNVQFTFLRAGHALGAASVKLRINEGGTIREIVFSGDIGNDKQRLDNRIDYPDSADYVVMESLYGGKYHDSREKDEARLGEIIEQTYAHGGNIIIPSFTYQRSQELLFTLKQLLDQGRIPGDIKIYLDSPLGIRVTEIYKRYFEYLNPKLQHSLKSANALFDFHNVIPLESNKQSMRIRKKRGSIIIAGHGMCVGGRVIFHLIENLPDPRSSVVFVGYQAEGTLGRQIVGGEKELLIEETRVAVRASIYQLNSFSAHADHDHLLTWVKKIDTRKLRKVFLVHAEESTSIPFKGAISELGLKAEIPAIGDSFELV